MEEALLRRRSMTRLLCCRLATISRKFTRRLWPWPNLALPRKPLSSRRSRSRSSGWLRWRKQDLTRRIADAATRLMALASRLSGRVGLIAKKRGYEQAGTVGDAVEYRPADHEADIPLEGVRVVRIVAPRIERRLPQGVSQLVLKAKVEPG